MPIMKRPLGGTGANVTILGYGAMELRGRPRGPEITDEDAGRLLNAVLDSGINLIDTSNPAHLAANIAVAQRGPLPADLYEEAKKRLPE
jgi:predicted aldo/keto reductase-like oxidoreductase